jgi:putative hemolysin
LKDSVWLSLLLQLILIICNAIFACAEIAVISMNDNRLAKLAAEGDKRAVRLARLTSQPARFLATIQVAITLSGFLGSAFAADNFSDGIVDWLIGLGVKISPNTLNTIAVVLITLILSYVTLIFGELVPKRVAMRKAEKLSLAISGLVSFISKLFAPIVWLLTVSTNAILRLVGIDPNEKDEEVSEEEIRMMVDVGSEKGVIDAEEQMMIQNVFEFDDLSVEEFATHRTDMVVLWEDETVEQWNETIRESRHSLYPVCGETADDVIGVLNAKDYFRLEDRTRENILREAVRPAYFVPQSIRADVLFRQMKKTRNHFAVVLDEYGGVQGIVTMNDLLEQLVGDLDDDIGMPEEPGEIEQLDESTWRILGTAPLDDVAEQLHVTLPTEEYDTFGGFVFGSYGSVPDDGTQFEIDACGLHIKVVEIAEHRVEQALVCPLRGEPENPADQERD